MDGNTGSFHLKSNSNSASTNSVTESATTYKEEQINVGVSDNNTEDQPKAVIYIRVSSKRQSEEGISLEAQETNCTNYGRMKRYNVVKVFVDDGVSATKHLWTRPAGKAMKDYIQNHGIKHIIIVKVDRLFRTVQDMLTTVDELTKKDVGMHVVEFGGQALDTTSAMGRFFLTMIGGIAELESGQISERTKDAIKHIKDKNKRFTGEIYADLVNVVRRMGITFAVDRKRVAVDSILSKIHSELPGSYALLSSIPDVVGICLLLLPMQILPVRHYHRLVYQVGVKSHLSKEEMLTMIGKHFGHLLLSLLWKMTN